MSQILMSFMFHDYNFLDFQNSFFFIKWKILASQSFKKLIYITEPHL